MSYSVITTEGWYLLSTETSLTCNEAMIYFGLPSTDYIHPYIYELSGVPITEGTTLTNSHWKSINVSENSTLLPYKGYWIKVTSLPDTDTTAPSVVSFTISDTTLIAGKSYEVTLVFSEAVTDFSSNEDITTQNGTLYATSFNGVTWKGLFTPANNIEDSTNILTLNSTYTDIAGNTGPSNTTSNYAVDTVEPTVSSFTIEELSLPEYTAIVELVFSEAVSNFLSSEDITLENGTLTTMTSSDNNVTWIGVFTANDDVEDTTNVLTLSTNYTDEAGNIGPSATTANFEIDSLPPSINAIETSAMSWGAVLNTTDDDSNGTVTVTTSGVEDGQTITITLNSATYTNTVSSNSSTVTITASGLQALTDGQSYTLTADVSDLTGNDATTVTSSSFTVDTSVPSISAIGTNVMSWGSELDTTESASNGTVTVTTVGVEDGQTVTITLNSATYTNTVSNNSSTITITAAGLQALTEEQNYTLTADVSDEAGNDATTVTSSSFYVQSSSSGPQEPGVTELAILDATSSNALEAASNGAYFATVSVYEDTTEEQDILVVTSTNQDSRKGGMWIYKSTDNGENWINIYYSKAPSLFRQDWAGCNAITKIGTNYWVIVTAPKGLDNGGAAMIYKFDVTTVTNATLSSPYIAVASSFNYNTEFNSSSYPFHFAIDFTSSFSSGMSSSTENPGTNGVDLHGEYMIVGAPRTSSWTGEAYVYVYDSTETFSWKLDEELHNLSNVGTLSQGDGFGYGVKIFDTGSDVWAVVGSPRWPNNSWKGKIYIFKKSNNSWSYQTTIESDTNSTFFGLTKGMALSANYLVVGTIQNTRTVYIYELNNNFYERTVYASSYQRFGTNVDIIEDDDGDAWIVTTDPSYSGWKGGFFILKRNSSTGGWDYAGPKDDGSIFTPSTVTSNNSRLSDKQICITNKYCIVGAPRNNSNSNAVGGEVYIYNGSLYHNSTYSY